MVFPIVLWRVLSHGSGDADDILLVALVLVMLGAAASLFRKRR